MPQRIYAAQTHRYFDSLVSCVAGITSLGLAMEAQNGPVIGMLQRPEGATIGQICEATGWQSHTVRGTFAGPFKKKLGLPLNSEKPESGERIYRIGPANGSDTKGSSD